MPPRKTPASISVLMRRAKRFEIGERPVSIHEPNWLKSPFFQPSRFSVVDHLIQQRIHSHGNGLVFVRKRDYTRYIDGMNVTVGRVYPLWNPETRKIVGKIDFPHEGSDIQLFVADKHPVVGKKAINWEKFRQGLEELLETRVSITNVDPEPDTGVGK